MQSKEMYHSEYSLKKHDFYEFSCLFPCKYIACVLCCFIWFLIQILQTNARGKCNGLKEWPATNHSKVYQVEVKIIKRCTVVCVFEYVFLQEISVIAMENLMAYSFK